MLTKTTISLQENQLNDIDKLAEKAGLSRSEYMTMCALKRRNQNTVTAPITLFKPLSEAKSKLGSVIHGYRRNEDVILDLLEIEEQLANVVQLCLANQE